MPSFCLFIGKIVKDLDLRLHIGRVVMVSNLGFLPDYLGYSTIWAYFSYIYWIVFYKHFQRLGLCENVKKLFNFGEFDRVL